MSILNKNRGGTGGGEGGSSHDTEILVCREGKLLVLFIEPWDIRRKAAWGRGGSRRGADQLGSFCLQAPEGRGWTARLSIVYRRSPEIRVPWVFPDSSHCSAPSLLAGWVFGSVCCLMTDISSKYHALTPALQVRSEVQGLCLFIWKARSSETPQQISHCLSWPRTGCLTIAEHKGS